MLGHHQVFTSQSEIKNIMDRRDFSECRFQNPHRSLEHALDAISFKALLVFGYDLDPKIPVANKGLGGEPILDVILMLGDLGLPSRDC